MRRICVFCGSRPGVRPAYRAAAEALGQLLAERGIELVYGGGNVGLMGCVADACLAAGGKVVGALFVGLDFSRELGELKARIKHIKVGETGYIYALDATPALMLTAPQV